MQQSILILENELDLARLYRISLERKGFLVSCFLNPLDALENFNLDTNFYATILTDLLMPDMNGIEFAKHIRRIRKNISIWLMTPYPSHDQLNRHENYKLFDKVLTKPIIVEKLISEVQDQLSLVKPINNILTWRN